MVEKLVYEGEENGIYAMPLFYLKVERWDPDIEITVDVLGMAFVHYVAALPSFGGAKIVYQGKIEAYARVTAEGDDESDVERLAVFLEAEQASFLSGIARWEEQREQRENDPDISDK